MHRILLIALMLALTGCSAGARQTQFGAMPPIVPSLDAAGAGDDGAAAESAGSAWPSVDPAVAADEGDAGHRLDVLWAQGRWDEVIRLLETERSKPDAIFDAATLREKLYAAQINAGYNALRLNAKDEAMDHFFAAMALAPERVESEPGLIVVQNRYVDEAKQILQTLEQERARQAAETAAQPPASD